MILLVRADNGFPAITGVEPGLAVAMNGVANIIRLFPAQDVPTISFSSMYLKPFIYRRNKTNSQ